MEIFPLPQSVLDRINDSCRNFLWGKADIGKNKPLVAWNKLMSFILRLAKRNRLLTLDKVAFLNKGSLCPLCSNEPESNAHLFFSCRKSLQVWAHIRDLAPFRRRFTSLQRITDSLIRGKSTSGVQGKLCCLAIAITVYYI
ncbi:hypothetical protein GmHk_17G049147 [Glycine max]|nr:hypothetical protein GmHk_17G049147 [Glycine max]